MLQQQVLKLASLQRVVMLNLVEIYQKRYKQFLAVTFVLLLVFSGILIFNKISTGEFIEKDVSLTGGTLITVHSDTEFDLQELESAVGQELDSSVNVRKLQALGGASVGYSFTIKEGIDTDAALAAIGNSGLDVSDGKYTIEQASSTISETFWKNTLIAVAIAFAAMSVVVLIYFRSLVPSLAVILASASDLLGTLAVMNILGIDLSIGGVAALLMIIGYSVDTDILLTTKLLRRTETDVSERIRSSVKTGLTMQLTAIAAMAVLYFVSPAEVLKQIAAILMIGLALDIPFTWIQNIGIMLLYLEKKEGKKDVKA